MNSDFEKSLSIWAEKAVSYCHDIAVDKSKDFDLSFYAFRTEPKEYPEILFLGINPGEAAYPYKCLYDNPIWGLVDEQRMTPERFIKADPSISEIQNWKIWKELKKSFKNEKLKGMLENSVYMNLIYFNTPNLVDLLSRNNSKAVFLENVKLTVELITKIIRPKNIICLGTGNCFDELPLEKNSIKILLSGKKRLVVKGLLDNINVYGIPHPSGSYTSDVDKQRIEDILNEQL